MKKFTNILSLILVVVMSLSVIVVYADDAVISEYIPEIEDIEQLDETVSEESNLNEELIPLASGACIDQNYYRGGTHYVIAPAYPTMTEAVFRALCSRINNP